jgi:hypothetical protein
VAQRKGPDGSRRILVSEVSMVARELRKAEAGVEKMNINLLPFTVLWMILTSVVVGLALFRKWIAKDEDESIHVSDFETGLVAQQVMVAHKLDVIDRWGKTLTAVALAYGFIVGAAYLYQSWLASTSDLLR